MKENYNNPMKKILGDIPVQVRVGLGQTTTPVRGIMELKKGSLVRLGVTIGEPLDIIIAGRLMARGEVVIVNDRYGIRVSEIL